MVAVLVVSGVVEAAAERRGATVEFFGAETECEIKGLLEEIDWNLTEGRGLIEEARGWNEEGLKVVMELERAVEAAIDESSGWR